jgi:hypothetical protein
MSQLIDYAEKNDTDILHLLNEDPIEDDRIQGLEDSDEHISYDRDGNFEQDEDESETMQYMSRL